MVLVYLNLQKNIIHHLKKGLECCVPILSLLKPVLRELKGTVYLQNGLSMVGIKMVKSMGLF